MRRNESCMCCSRHGNERPPGLHRVADLAQQHIQHRAALHHAAAELVGHSKQTLQSVAQPVDLVGERLVDLL